MSKTYEVEARVIAVLEPEELGKYLKTTLIVREMDDYPQEMAVDFWNAATEHVDPLEKGDHIVLSFRVKSREYNGKWYTNLSGQSVTVLPSATPPQWPPVPAPRPAPPPRPASAYKPDYSLDDDVPF